MKKLFLAPVGRLKPNHNKGLAFTLAEVLITLGIIGVVSAITIPTLMNKTNESELKTKWKKIYSELSQAQQLIMQDNGGDFSGQCENYDDICLRDLFATKLRVSKKCVNPVDENCVVADSKFLNGTTESFGMAVNDLWPGLITSNGYSIKFRFHEKDCTHAYPRQCGWMQVDVNGLKKPNIGGKDIFWINIEKNKLDPWGIPPDLDPTTDCATGGSGISCSVKYLID